MRLLLVVCALAAGSLVACSNFNKFQTRAKQSEAKTELKSVYVAFKSMFAETGKCPTTLKASGWTPFEGNLYTYYLGKDSVQSSKGAALALPKDVKTFVKPEAGEFQIAAIANIDGDDTVDVWTIDHNNELKNVVNDVAD